MTANGSKDDKAIRIRLWCMDNVFKLEHARKEDTVLSLTEGNLEVWGSHTVGN